MADLGDSVGLTTTHSVQLFDPTHPLVLASGERLDEVVVAYETGLAQAGS